MKKILLITVVLSALAANASAQASFGWQTPGDGRIQYSTDNVSATLAPRGSPSIIPGYGQLNVGFFAALDGTHLTLGPDGLPNFTGWTDLGVDLSRIIIAPGRMTSTVSLPLSFTAGANVELEVVGWAGMATSWAQALEQGASLLGFSGEIFNGSILGALGWSQPTGDPNGYPVPNPPAPVVTGPGAYQGLVLEPVPEPTTIALGGLGGALLFFRTLKNRRMQSPSR